ncbi:MAG: RNA polymerase sigma factor [Propionicimonas sp.]|nr:RNA polymerase sigma factor [Propionicimonas sp.]
MEQTAAPSRPELTTAEAFSRWVEPHWDAMARLAGRSGTDPDDILQDALLAAWRKRDQFDPDRGPARTWLLAITADQRRRAWRRAVRLLPWTVADPPDPSSLGEGRSHAVDLRRALRRLPEQQALAVDLHYYLDLGIADVAAVMRCPEGTVKSLLSRARGRLRGILGEDYR